MYMGWQEIGPGNFRGRSNPQNASAVNKPHVFVARFLFVVKMIRDAVGDDKTGLKRSNDQLMFSHPMAVMP